VLTAYSEQGLYRVCLGGSHIAFLVLGFDPPSYV
jgi:hypothetical protein